MGYQVIEVMTTPNPNAFKLVLDRQISDKTVSFFNAQAGAAHPLASQLFGIEGVSSVLILNDFVTINKTPVIPWKKIRPAVERVLKAYEG